MAEVVSVKNGLVADGLLGAEPRVREHDIHAAVRRECTRAFLVLEVPIGERASIDSEDIPGVSGGEQYVQARRHYERRIHVTAERLPGRPLCSSRLRRVKLLSCRGVGCRAFFREKASEHVCRRHGQEGPGPARTVEHPLLRTRGQHRDGHFRDIQRRRVAAVPAVHGGAGAGPKCDRAAPGQAVREGVTGKLGDEWRDLRGIEISEIPTVQQHVGPQRTGVLEASRNTLANRILSVGLVRLFAADPEAPLRLGLCFVVELRQE